MKRRLYTLDVFTAKPFAGNPLAVITDGDGLSTAKMQSIAREMNLSETVFIQRPTNNRALARLRIFTTTRELPFAGHPVIGTWFLLAELGVVPASEGSVRILQQTGAGILPVEFMFHNGRPVLVTMTQKPARFSRAPFTRATLAAALGLKPSDLAPSLPPEFVSTGISNLMVPISRRAVLAKIQMNMRALAHLVSPHGTMAYCFVQSSSSHVYARGMVPWGTIEDPATGSAGGSLGAYLVHHGQMKPSERLQITQGVEMGRPSEIHVEVISDRGKLTPKVSGSAVRILEGHIEA
jgi:trans-2,3-dihydro-3-hydroxyanthranilate isomerase